MKGNTRSLQVLGLLLGGTLAVADAAPVTFDFTNAGDGSAGSSVTFSSAGFDLEVTARGPDGADADVFLFPEAGLGVAGGTGENTVGTDELLNFDLTPFQALPSVVVVLDITTGLQTLDLLVDGTFVDTFELTGGSGGVSPPDVSTIDLSGIAVAGRQFSIVAGDGPGITVRSLELDVVTRVTEPAPLALVLAGACVLGLSRRLAG